MLALKTAAIPIIIKLTGITLTWKKVFKTEASNNPKNAPINKLGAKTPPSPPEASVIEVTMGFKINIPIKVKAKVTVSGSWDELPKIPFIAWYPSPYNCGNINKEILNTTEPINIL